MHHRRSISVIDLETDPFEAGKMVHPFVAGFYDGHTYKHWWSDNCVDESVAYLNSLSDPLIIYAHNGGRFDFFYYLPHLEHDLRIVNSRIIQARMGKHELRDSFAIMPFALETYKKTPIDYDKFKRKNRAKYRDEIVSYLRDDCVDLYTLCVAFAEEFGDSLTIGSASLRQLKKFHSFKSGNQEYDGKFREHFYFGGRCQVFQSGISTGPIAVYDVNSMYPAVMRDNLHPVSTGIYRGKTIDDRTCFITTEGHNLGAFPIRQKDNSLDFTHEYGIYHTTIHEFNAALETKTFHPKRIIETLGFSERICFDDFVNHFYDARRKAKAEGDKIRTIFYKFVMNSGYGKFAQNPENYADWYITEIGKLPPGWHNCEKSCVEDCRLKWTPAFTCLNYIIWERPLKELFYYNIATGASITGAARAVLLKGIAHATRPIYCDTDSIICRELTRVPISEDTLGAWKIEAMGNRAAVCRKKLYAIYNTPDGSTFDPSRDCIKKANKGAHLTGSEIWRIANGATIEWSNPVPSFKWDGSYRFTKRRISGV